MRNGCVELSSPCGPPLAQLNGINLIVDVYEQDLPDYALSDLRIEVEKFLVNYSHMCLFCIVHVCVCVCVCFTVCVCMYVCMCIQ